MELAQAIVGVAAQQVRENSMAEACKLSVVIYYPDPSAYEEELQEDTHIIIATPMCQHVLLQYKSLNFRLPRSDKAAWEDTVGFLFETIKNRFEAFLELTFVDAYGHSYAPGKFEFKVQVTTKDTEVLAVKVESWEAVETKMQKYLMAMRHVAAVQ
jgi:hypothetical protein